MSLHLWTPLQHHPEETLLPLRPSSSPRRKSLTQWNINTSVFLKEVTCNIWYGMEILSYVDALHFAIAMDFLLSLCSTTYHNNHNICLRLHLRFGQKNQMMSHYCNCEDRHLHQLIPHRMAVWIVDGTGSSCLPNPLEVEHPGGPEQVQHRGLHMSTATAFPLSAAVPRRRMCKRSISLYHDDPEDRQGPFLHSAPSPMTETQIMKFLCVLGYARAVVLQHIELTTDGHASFSIISSQMYQYDNQNSNQE